MMASTSLMKLSEDLRKLNDTDLFWERIAVELEHFGVTSFLYGAIASKIEVQERGFDKSVVLKSNHPKEFLDLFNGHEFLDNDLTAYRALEGTEFSFWHHEQLWDEAPIEQKIQSDIENELGLQVGITVPTEMLTCGSLGGISICTNELVSHEFDMMWIEHGTEITQILGFLDVGMRQQHLSSIISLAPREKEVLKWLASGLRPEEIAFRLGIGYRTVDKYINGAKGKLNATTRDQAVAKAIIFNAIQL